MISPLDRERLKLRIERLQRQRTHGWHPADELEFRNQLPNSRVPDPRRKLPAPAAVSGDDFTLQQYRDAIQRCLRMEGLVNSNRPGGMKRVVRDIQRGRFPGR